MVAADPDARTLTQASAALRPGGACYAEWHARPLGGVGSITRQLRAAGFGDIRVYLAWPSVSAPYVWLPLDSLAAIGYFRRHLHARTPAREPVGRAWRFGVTLAAKLGLVGPLSIVARKPERSGEGTAEPELAAMVRQGWAGWGLEGEPAGLAMLLLTRGPRTANKIAGLIFGGGGARPRLVVKIARVGDARSGILREATTLPALQAACLDRLKGAPRVLFTVDHEDGGAVGETALPGVPLHTFLTPRNYRAYALQATDWLCELAKCSRRDAVESSAERLVEDALADFARSFGPAIEPDLLATTARAVARLGTFPRVCEHRDFAPWNVFVTKAGGFAVLDWESSEPQGLPGLDLEYFLSYLAFALDRARDPSAMVRSYRALRDPTSMTGSVHRECIARYAGRVGLKPADFHAVRLLTWLIHSRSEFRRLTGDLVGSPPPEALRESLFVGLWREELRLGA